MSKQITIEKQGNTIIVDFGGYFPETTKIKRGSYSPSEIIKGHETETNVVFWESDGKAWKVVHPQGDPEHGLVVATVNGEIPQSLFDLHNKINALR